MDDSLTKPDRYSHPGVAGRKPKPSTLVSRGLAVVDKNIPAIFEALIDKALGGDREAQIYLIDRRLGKPKATTELDLTGGEALGSGLMLQIAQAMLQSRQALDKPLQIEEGEEQSEQL